MSFNSRLLLLTLAFTPACAELEPPLTTELGESHEELLSVVGAQASADLAFASRSHGTVFHVSVKGSDSNPGTAESPWRTIGKAARTLSAGQTAYVHAGRYDEHIDVTGRDGTASAPITLMGAPGEAKPLVVASRNASVFRITRGYWRLQGFEINGNGVQGQGVRVDGGHHVLVADNIVRDGSGGSAISVHGGARDVGILRNRISNYRWYVNGARRDSHGIHILPDATRVLVQENESSGNSGDGLQCTGVAEAGFGSVNPYDIVIEDNRFHHNGENAVDIKTCHRITVRGGPKDSSKFYGHRAAEDTGSHCAGAAVVVHYNATKILFERNRIWDNGIGITIGRDDALTGEIVIRQNVFFANTTAGRGCGDGVRIARARGVEVYNNTFDGMPRSAIRVGADTYNTKSESVSIWNNIIRNSGNALDVFTSVSPGFTSDRNLVFHASGSPTYRHNGAARTLQQWTKATGLDKTSKVADPRFPSNPLASDYVLTSGSPAIDMGMKLQSTPFCGGGYDVGFREACP